MSRVTEQTPQTDITVQGLTFSAPQPYNAGAIELTEGEASALNQTFAENLRNNFASTIRSKLADYRKANNLPEDAEVGVDVLDKSELDSEFAKYAGEYEFGVRRTASGVRMPTDPVEREAYKIATDRVKAALNKKNVKLNTVPREKMDELVRAAIAKYPEITNEARRRVEASAAIGMADLDL